MFAIAPKCYILKSSKIENGERVKKIKGVSFRLNNKIELESYKTYFLKSSNHIMRINRSFMVVKYEQRKNTINRSTLEKRIILENHSYTHFLPNLTKEDYYFAK
jgi:hypothetical protein